jgi:hypothetical protein
MNSQAEETTFKAALELGPEERATYLDRVCHRDAGLRAGVGPVSVRPVSVLTFDTFQRRSAVEAMAKAWQLPNSGCYAGPICAPAWLVLESDNNRPAHGQQQMNSKMAVNENGQVASASFAPLPLAIRPSSPAPRPSSPLPRRSPLDP